MMFDLKINEIYSFINELRLNNIDLDDYISIYKKDSKNAKHAVEILKEFSFYEKLENIKHKINILQKKAFAMKCSSLIDNICEETDYYAFLATKFDNELCLANVEKLKRQAIEYEHRTGNTSYDFICSLVYSSQNGVSISPVPKLEVNAVHLMTIHKSKGLEFPITFLADYDYNQSDKPNKETLSFVDKEPIINILDDNYLKLEFTDLEDEKNTDEKNSEKNRLLYVALTRASKKLIISGNSKAKTDDKNIFKPHFNLSSNDIISSKKIDEENGNIKKNIEIEYYSSENLVVSQDIDMTTLNLHDVYEIKSDVNNENFIIKKLIYKKPSDNFIVDSSIERKKRIKSLENLMNKKITYFDESEGIIEEHDLYNEEKETLDAMSLGTVLHNVFEIFDFHEYRKYGNEYKDKLIRKTLNILNIYKTIDIESVVTKSFELFLSNEHIKNLISLKEVLVSRENSFKQITYDDNGNKIVINGRIDLVTKDDNNYYVLDYKTTKYRDDLYKKYENQLNMYRDFISECYNVARENVIAEIICLK